MDYLEKMILIAPKERKSVLLSFFFFFSLLCSYFILRPIRDEMGIQNGAENMQWLFTGTFLAMLVIVPVFALLNRMFNPSKLLLSCYTFFILNILCFYIMFRYEIGLRVLPTVFFIWTSVFNLFVVSLFWSFMADVFSSGPSKRVFGLIAAGGSLGALAGPLLSHQLTRFMGFVDMLPIAGFLLFIGIICMIGLTGNTKNAEGFQINRSKYSNKGLFDAIGNTFRSSYLLGIVTFVLLYTSISTFLYFEQAHLLEASDMASNQRLAYFAKVDFMVNTLAIVGQLFFTARIIKKIGLHLTMAVVPLLVSMGLLLMGFKLSLILIAALLIVHRAGNFFLLRPSKEILFTVTPHNQKYQSKNFIDTAIYRGGDAMTGWLFAGFTSLGLGLSTIALIAVPFALLWSYNGLKLGLAHAKKETKTF